MPENELPGTSVDDQNADVPAPQRRVTPQELTLALTLLKAHGAEAERRREKEARSLAETVPLGPLVEQTGLAVTPEQIWAEVQALRARAGHSSAPEPGQDAKPSGHAYRLLPAYHADAAFEPGRRGTLGPVLLGFVALAMVLFAFSSLRPAGMAVRRPRPAGSTSWPQGFSPQQSGLVPASPHPSFFQPTSHRVRSDSPFDVTAPDAEFYHKLNVSQGQHPQCRILLHRWGAETLPGQAVYPLNAVPDGCTFYRPQFTGVSFSSGSPAGPACVFEEISKGMAAPMWMMTRYNGRYYQHTWIRRGDIVRLVQGNALDLYPTPSVQDLRGLTPLTLAVGSHPTNCDTGSARDTFQSCFQDTFTGPIMRLPEGKKTALDGHAWEDFTAFPPREYQAPAWDKEPGTFAPDRRQGFGAADFDASARVEPLQSVPDGAPVHCSSFTLDQMLHSYPYRGTTLQVLVDARPYLDRPWTVINLGGRVYLLGWITGRPARSSLAGRELVIFSDSHAPEFITPPAQIMLPLNGLTWRGTEGGASPTPENPGSGGRITVSDIHLDGHAWDKW